MEPISQSLIDESLAAFEAKPQYTVAMNSLQSSDPNTVHLNREHAAAHHSHHYSVMVTNQFKATSQKASGRCWIFAMCNCIRAKLLEKYKLPDTFELSQTFVFFYDKLERVNYFLEHIIETRSEELDGRLVQHLLTCPLNDGGQWDMLVNVVEKYGLCPKSSFPDAWSATASRKMNSFLTGKLREWACAIRTCPSEDIQQMRALKSKYLVEAHRVLMIHLGKPPAKFDWTFHEKGDAKTFHRYNNLTPISFRDVHCDGYDVTSRVSLINDPRNSYYKAYTVHALGNVVGGKNVYYVNVPVDVLKKYTREMLKDNETVWFGCDVGKEFNRSTQIMDVKQFNYELAFGTRPTQTKEERLRYGQSLMTHAMAFTGLDEVEGEEFPAKWRVENSWGKDTGDDGYAMMTNEWFNEYMFQIVVDKKRLLSDEKIKAVLESDAEPVILPAWDPMGALA